MSNAILSCDWGTSSFRLRLVRIADGVVLAETKEGKGIAAVYNEWQASGKPAGERLSFYQQILSSAIGELRAATAGLPVIISGMASSSIGMMELPYGDLPFSLRDSNLPVKKIAATSEFPHDIILISGLKTSNDVMRGEETMLIGCDVYGIDEWLVIFPGTHSKHAVVKNGILSGFRTYMTGEVFELLATKSILSKSLSKTDNDKRGDSFNQGVKESIEGNLLNNIFHVRTRQLLDNIDPSANYHYLSGLIIGNELKDSKPISKRIMLVCSDKLGELYAHALQIITGTKPEYRDADKLLVEGHCRLIARLA